MYFRAPFGSAQQGTTASEQSGSWHNRSDNSNPLPCNSMQTSRLWLIVSPILQVRMVIILMVPFFSLMILTILLESLQLLLTMRVTHLHDGERRLDLTGLDQVPIDQAGHSHFLAVPENWVWVEATYFSSCTGWIGHMLSRSMKAIHVGFCGTVEHLRLFKSGLCILMLIGDVSVFSVTGILFPVDCMYAFAGIVFGFAWFCREPSQIFTPLDPSHKLEFISKLPRSVIGSNEIITSKYRPE